MLEAINLCKRFEGRTVLENVNLHLKPGGQYVLMGPSGCGKTTLLNLLMGLLKPDGGTIRRAPGLRLSAVFQEDRLLPQMTALANIALVSPAPAQAIEKMLLELGIEMDSLSQPVSAFSGGMKRRVALCRALMADYDVLFLDEPYKGLDEDTRTRVMHLVKEHTQGKTVLLVTHDREEADGYEPLWLWANSEENK